MAKPPAQKNLFTTQEICTIMETSGKAGVRRIKYGELEIEFGAQPTLGMAPTPAPSDWLKQPLLGDRADHTMSPSALPPERASSEPIQKTEKELVAEELALRESQLELMKLEDPALYESLLQLEGELVDDGSIDADDESGGNRRA